jgi:hypothetical protein
MSIHVRNSNRWNEAPNYSESIRVPIFTLKQLSTIVFRWEEIEGFSLYHGILIVWDGDGTDDRVFMLIDEEFVGKGVKPLAVCYRKGGIDLLWQDGLYGRAGSYRGRDGYDIMDGDMWCATHHYLSGGEVHQLGPVEEDLKVAYPDGVDGPTEGFEELDDEPTVLA